MHLYSQLGEEQGKKENVVIATKKGVAVLDRWIPDDIKATYHVLQYVQSSCLDLFLFTFL